MKRFTNMKRMVPIKEGELVLVSTGCYSDYSIQRVCRATRDIDVEAEIYKFLELHPKNDDDEVDPYEFGDAKFMRYLGDALEEIPFRELHLGDYTFFALEELWLDNYKYGYCHNED